MIRWTLVICALLAMTFALYWPARGYGFLNLDDLDNVAHNPLVFNGLTPDGLIQAMRTSQPDYWRPLCWVSFMIDTEIYRAKPHEPPGRVKQLADEHAWGYHITNIVLHALAAVLLLAALHALTGAFWPSAVVAAIFAVHPLRVESVAWITERKDVLSGVFAFLALWSYAIHARSPAWWRMGLTTILLGMGLMSKSSLVTLPLVFLLLDYWPLKRIDFSADWPIIRRRIGVLLLEKILLFVIMALSCLMTMRGGARSVADLPLSVKLPNVVMSYLRYIGKAFWPADLAVYYPYPGMGGADAWQQWQVAGAGAILLVITMASLALSRTRPYLIVGWLWFVGMLVPVIGLLQVGNQGMADRFTYLPSIGLSIIVVWAAGDMAQRWRGSRWVWGSLAAAALIACAVVTVRYLPHWKDSDALFQRALAVTTQNRAVHAYYGDYLFHQERFAEALEQFEQAAAITPLDAMPHFKLGWIYATMNNKEYQAQQEFERAIELDPDHADAHFNLAVMLAKRGNTLAAQRHRQRAKQLNPGGAANYDELWQHVRIENP